MYKNLEVFFSNGVGAWRPWLNTMKLVKRCTSLDPTPLIQLFRFLGARPPLQSMFARKLPTDQRNNGEPFSFYLSLMSHLQLNVKTMSSACARNKITELVMMMDVDCECLGERGGGAGGLGWWWWWWWYRPWPRTGTSFLLKLRS